MALFALKDIKPNPFRRVDRYPIDPEKINSLRESIRTTGFWDNVVGRRRGSGVEIAYGHHRIQALREEFGDDHKIQVILRDLDDAEMLRIMSRENLEEFGHSNAMVNQETVHAVVEAYATEKITLAEPEVYHTKRPQTVRYAPSFTPGRTDHAGMNRYPYTAETVADFLGWIYPDRRPKPTIYMALEALQAVEEGIIEEIEFKGLAPYQVGAVVSEARKRAGVHLSVARLAARDKTDAEKAAKKATSEPEKTKAQLKAARAHEREEKAKVRAKEEARTAARVATKALKSGEYGYKRVGEAVEAVMGRMRQPKSWSSEHIDDNVRRRIIPKLSDILDPATDSRAKLLEEFLPYIQYLSEEVRRDLILTLDRVSERAQQYASKADSVPPQLPARSAPKLAERTP